MISFYRICQKILLGIVVFTGCSNNVSISKTDQIPKHTPEHINEVTKKVCIDNQVAITSDNKTESETKKGDNSMIAKEKAIELARSHIKNMSNKINLPMPENVPIETRFKECYEVKFVRPLPAGSVDIDYYHCVEIDAYTGKVFMSSDDTIETETRRGKMSMITKEKAIELAQAYVKNIYPPKNMPKNVAIETKLSECYVVTFVQSRPPPGVIGGGDYDSVEIDAYTGKVIVSYGAGE